MDIEFKIKKRRVLRYIACGPLGGCGHLHETEKEAKRCLPKVLTMVGKTKGIVKCETTVEYFNGKPMTHWEAEAEKLVIGCILSAAQLDPRSIIGAMAHKRLMEIANAENPELVKQLTKQHAQYMRNIARFVSSFSKPARRRRKRA